MRTYKIHLIRTGLTQANTEGIYCGSSDIPLSDEGKSELRRMAGEYTYPYADTVYISPLLRARESAEILFPDCAYEVVEDFREASFGIYEGKSFSELSGDESFQRWVAFGGGDTPPGAEPNDVFQRRCVEGFIEMVQAMMRSGIFTAAVVTHAGVIANILAALAFPRRSAYDWQTWPGCGYTVSADPMLFLRDPVVEAVALVPVDLEID